MVGSCSPAPVPTANASCEIICNGLAFDSEVNIYMPPAARAAVNNDNMLLRTGVYSLSANILHVLSSIQYRSNSM